LQPQAETPSRTVTLLGAHAGTGDPGAWGLSSDSEYFFAIDRTGLARVWDVNSGALLGSFQSLKPPIRSASLSPGGKWLAVSVEREEAASLFDCRAGGRPRELAGHRDFVSGLAFAPDGATLATASVDGTIRLWRSADGVCLGVLPGHLQETTDVAFSPDGRTLASISRHESLKLWHLPAMREVFSLSLPNAGEHLQFSPDGQKLAVNMDDGKVLLLEAP